MMPDRRPLHGLPRPGVTRRRAALRSGFVFPPAFWFCHQGWLPSLCCLLKLMLSLTMGNSISCAHEVGAAYRFAKAEARVQIPLSTLGDRLTVGPRVLIPAMEVQVLLPDSMRRLGTGEPKWP